MPPRRTPSTEPRNGWEQPLRMKPWQQRTSEPSTSLQQVEPSTAPQQDQLPREQVLGSEEEIVKLFYQAIKVCQPLSEVTPDQKSGEVTTDQKSKEDTSGQISGEVTKDQKSKEDTTGQKCEEITMYRYVIKNPIRNSWADGEISSYSSFKGKWENGIIVKFYILEDINKEEAARISQKVDALISMQSYTNVLTPIFEVYNERINSVIVCYPHFDLHLRDWLGSDTGAATLQDVEENLLQPTWINFIRDTLSCIEPVDQMAISRFGEMTSYVWKEQSKSIKIILFPCENHRIGVQDILVEFSGFLNDHIRTHWRHPELQEELDSFILFLKAWPKKPESIRHFWANLAGHPLLQDYDYISSLIRMTWRPHKVGVSKTQISELKSNIIYPDGHHSWRQVKINDPVMLSMSSSTVYSDDQVGFFHFIKDMGAHYPEYYRKNTNDPNGPKHPVSLIKDTYHYVIAQIHVLSLKTNWLT